MLDSIKKYFGFVKEDDIQVVYPDSFALRDNLGAKLEYLKVLDADENDRRTTIDTKTSQLIGQTAIIFSIISIFISNYISKFNSGPIYFQIILIIVFLMSLCFYLMTIIRASEYLNVKKYGYSKRSANTVTKFYESIDDFQIEEIKDVIYSIEKNTQLTNQKASQLIYSYRFFKLGTIFVGILSVLMIITAYVTPTKSETTITISKPIKVTGIDSITFRLNELSNKINETKESPCIKIKKCTCKKCK